VGLILNKASPLAAAILALAGFLIARIAGVFKKRATLKTIELAKKTADNLQDIMDAKDAGKSEKRSDKLKIEAVAGSSPVGTESWQNSYLVILFLSNAAQAISTAFSSLTIRKGEEYSLGVLTPQAFQYLAIALSILAIILPDFLNYFEERNQEKKLEAYKWRLNTLEILEHLSPGQADQVKEEIFEGQRESHSAASLPVLSVTHPPTGVVVVDSDKPQPAAEPSVVVKPGPDTLPSSDQAAASRGFPNVPTTDDGGGLRLDRP